MTIPLDVIIVAIVVIIAVTVFVVLLTLWLEERGRYKPKRDALRESARKVEHSSLVD